MHLTVQVSPGEFLDKLTILEIKSERIHDADKLQNVRRELEMVRAEWAAAKLSSPEVQALVLELRSVNETLWEIEDKIRAKDSRTEFDSEFIELARSVYRSNDRRAAIKRDINVALRSDLVEEKSYAKYERG